MRGLTEGLREQSGRRQTPVELRLLALAADAVFERSSTAFGSRIHVARGVGHDAVDEETCQD